MKQLTIRGFDGELEREIRRVAETYGISLNQAVLRILRRGAGLDEDRPRSNAIGDGLDRLLGTWTDAEAQEFDEAVRVFESIDEELWR